ncbi:MAG TPA: ABC transporter permease [Patescibacteria group bacterium]|jgi:ABC-2 type transport system permease protein|nr:ABC transporter permease [Patescibacteria group bacterium]
MNNTKRIIPARERQLKNHISLRQVIHDSLVMAYRGLYKMRHNPELFSDVTIQPIIFTLMFTYIFGGAIAGNVHNYLPTIIPGILAMTVLTTTLVTGVQIREDMDKGVFNRFRSMPMSRIAPLAGALLADIIRYCIATVLTLLMGYIIGWRPGGGFDYLVGGALLTVLVAWCISWVFAFIGMIARTASSVQGIGFLVLFPLTFLSNAFIPIKTLPGWLQAFVKVNPISHLVSAVRELANQGIIGHDFWYCLLGAAIVVAVFAPLTVRAYMHKA